MGITHNFYKNLSCFTNLKLLYTCQTSEWSRAEVTFSWQQQVLRYSRTLEESSGSTMIFDTEFSPFEA